MTRMTDKQLRRAVELDLGNSWYAGRGDFDSDGKREGEY
jgi:hypothetical protein